MKLIKAIVFYFFAFLILVLTYGCRNTYALPHDQFCFKLYDNSEIALSAEDKNYIIDILNLGDWTDSITNCECDFVFYTAKQEVRYHSECGTFNDCTNQRGFEVSEEHRLSINELLGVGDISLTTDKSEKIAVKLCTVNYEITPTPDKEKFNKA